MLVSWHCYSALLFASASFCEAATTVNWNPGSPCCETRSVRLVTGTCQGWPFLELGAPPKNILVFGNRKVCLISIYMKFKYCMHMNTWYLSWTFFGSTSKSSQLVLFLLTLSMLKMVNLMHLAIPILRVVLACQVWTQWLSVVSASAIGSAAAASVPGKILRRFVCIGRLLGIQILKLAVYVGCLCYYWAYVGTYINISRNIYIYTY